MAINPKTTARSATKKAKKSSNKSIKFASVREMKKNIDRDFYKYLKGIFGSDEEIHKKFTDDPFAFIEMQGEFDMMNRN